MLGGYQREGGLSWEWRTWRYAQDRLSLPWILWQWRLPESISKALRERAP